MSSSLRDCIGPRGAFALGIGLLAAAQARGIANASFSQSLSSVDVHCEQPTYQLSGAGDFTSNDDGLGNDHYALVMHDGAGNYIDVDFLALQTVGDSISTTQDVVAPTSFFTARPIVVRLHDIPDPGSINELSKQGLELATASPVLFELEYDPALDAVVCQSKRFLDPALRIESLSNGGGQTFSAPTLLNLDGLGGTALTVAVPDQSTLAVFYRAECSNDSAVIGSYVDVDILIDAVAVAPTQTGTDHLCVSNGTAGNDAWVMARASAAKLVPGPAVHAIQVRARGFGAFATLADSELVVMVPEPTRWQLQAVGIAALLFLAWRRAGRTRTRLRATLPVLCAIAALASPGADADTVLEHTSNTANQTFNQVLGPQLIDLGGGTSFGVTLERATRVTIFLTAECTVDAADSVSWLDLDIRVDGTAIPPSDQADDAFCTSTGATPGAFDRWIGAAIHVTVDLPAAPHAITVEGELHNNDPGERWWIGDLSLTVVGEER